MMITEAIGLGIIISFIFTELTALSAGLIVPGYLAFFLDSPTRIVITFIVALLSYFSVIFLARFIIIYGQRRFMLSVILGYLFSWILQSFFLKFLIFESDLRVIGYIIPGLIANNMISQGIIKTILATLIVTFITRFFILMTIMG